jgi:HEAT repeat protein
MHMRSSALWNGPDSVLVRLLTGYLHTKQLSPVENGQRRAVWLLSRARGNAIVDDLLLELGSSDWRAQSMAAWGLALGMDQRAVPGLMLQLKHPVWRVRAMAAGALQHIGDSSALPAVLRVLDDEAWQVRAPAVSFVGEHAAPSEAVRLIEPRLRDRHMAVRRAATEALEAIGDRIR